MSFHWCLKCQAHWGNPFFCSSSMHCVCFATRDCCVPINAPALHCTVHTNILYSRWSQVWFLVNTGSGIIFATAAPSVPIKTKILLVPKTNKQKLELLWFPTHLLQLKPTRVEKCLAQVQEGNIMSPLIMIGKCSPVTFFLAEKAKESSSVASIATFNSRGGGRSSYHIGCRGCVVNPQGALLPIHPTAAVFCWSVFEQGARMLPCAPLSAKTEPPSNASCLQMFGFSLMKREINPK